MNKAKLSGSLIAFMMVICLLLTGCDTPANVSSETQPAETEPVITEAAETVPEETMPEETIPEETVPEETIPEETAPPRTVKQISAAIYPDLPNIELFETLLKEKWAQLEPEVTLKLERWNCYTTPTNNCDVLMYDALVLTYLVENKRIQAIAPDDMENVDGIFPFAMDGAFHKGWYYGMPYFLCGDFLIYYKDDADVAAAENVTQLYTVGKKKQKENPDTGLVLYNENAGPYYYLDTYVDFSGKYTFFERTPDCKNLDKRLLRYQDELHSIKMEPTNEETKNMGSLELFARGYAFAFLGMSEHMCALNHMADQIAIKNFSFSEEENIPLYYMDIVSIASHVTDPEKLELCKKLMNLTASEEFLAELCYENGDPQYILPARESVYLAAEKDYPLYGQLHELVTHPANRVFRFGKDIYKYLQSYPAPRQ